MQNKNKIRILMISSSSKLGGGVKNMFDLGKNLKSKYEVYYALPDSENFSKNLNINNHINISERKLFVKDLINLYKFIKFNSIDILHAHGKGAGLISRIVNIFSQKKLIYTFHGIHYNPRNLLYKKLYVFYENFIGQIDSNKVLVSKSEMDFAKSSLIKLRNNSIIISNGVSNKEQKKYHKNLSNHATNKTNKFNVITVSRLENTKNIFDILKIAKLIPEVNFTILGEGSCWNNLNNQVLDEKINNVFLKGKKENVFEYLYKSDIYLTAAIYEGLSISILEAMSIGLPIVASNVRGNSDAIENGNSGYLYNLYNVEMAAKFIKMLVNDISLMEHIGNNAFIRQRNIFSLEKMIKSYEDLYQNNLK